MGTGYTRNDAANNIADGNIINASDLDGEFDAVESAFNSSSGHTHDGTSAEGAPIEVIGPTQDVVITASVLRPKTTNTVDLGTSSLEFKDAFFDGTVTTDALAVTAGITSNIVTVSSDDAGSAKGPQLDILRDSSSPADSDAIGHIDFSGKDDGDNKTTYASILASIGDVTDGTEDGTLKFNTMVAGSDTTTMTITESKVGIGVSPAFTLDVSTNSATTNDAVTMLRISANTTGTAANNFGAGINFSGEDASGSLRDLATINGIYTDATNRSSALTFKTRANLGSLTERMRIDSTGQVTITRADNGTHLLLESTDADASVGPVLNLFRNSASPADNDALGEIVFQGNNDAAGELSYAQIESFALDVSNGSEDGYLEMFTALAGTERVSRLVFNSTETVINNDSKDLNFRVESDGNANMLLIDAGRDKVFMGISGSDNDGTLIIEGDDALHPVIKIGSTSTNGINLLSDNYQLDESIMNLGLGFSGANVVFGRGVKVSPTTNNTYLSSQDTFTNQPTAIVQRSNSIQFLSAGSNTTTATDSAITMFIRQEMTATNTVFNDDSTDTDFRIESDGNSHMFFVDAGSNKVAIGGSSHNNGVALTLHANDDGGTPSSLVLRNTGTSGGSGARIEAGYVSGYGAAIKFTGNPSSQRANSIIFERVTASGPTYTTSGEFGTGGLFKTYDGAVFNESSKDVDFRIESDSNANMFTVDAGNNLVNFGKDSGGNSTVQGVYHSNSGSGFFHSVFTNTTSNADHANLFINRQSSDGQLIQFRQADTGEGSISVSGSTVSYNGFSGRHESSGIPTNTPVGTVVSTIDELDVYPDTTVDLEGNTITHNRAGQTRADHAKVEVSNSEGDPCVYGVVSEFDGDGKLIVTSVGIGSIRVTGACAKGDLLESNGDGTAKVQSDDIIRSKTIGKVTISNSNTGVKLVSCVMYCG